jgi:hypothetical protein
MQGVSAEDYGVDERGVGRSEDMTTGGTPVREHFVERMEGDEVYLPYDKKIVWLSKAGGRLAEEDWKGPSHESDRIVGPYHFLVLKKASNNIIPIAPILDILDLDELENLIYTKIHQSAAEHRHNVVTRNEGDAKRIKDAGEFEIVHIEGDPSLALKDLEVGGVSPQLMAAGMHVKQLLNWVAGNMDVLGGLGQSADTLGQERLLATTSSKKLEKFQSATIDFVRNIYYDLGFYEVNDPLSGGEVWKEHAALGIRFPKQVNPFLLREEFNRLNFAIDPYSLTERSPQARAAQLEQTIMTLMTGLQQQMMTQGVTIDVEALVKMLARYKNQPELTDILKFMGSAESMTQAPQGQRPPAPPFTSRENIRRNESGPDNQMGDQAIMALAQSGMPRG